MSSLAPETAPLSGTMNEDSAPTSTEALRLKWMRRKDHAKEARRPFERTMLSDLAFASGQHWLVYDDKQRRMRHIAEMDHRYIDRELVTVDRIKEFRLAQLGELEADDDRPTILVAQEGQTAEDAVEQLNSAVAYAWEHEWEAEHSLAQARRYCVDMGVAAIRCKWDPTKGETTGHVPIDQYGQPADAASILHLEVAGTMPDGSLPSGYKPVQDGATCWEAYSAFHVLPPPGINHERDFPWEILARPVSVESLKESYPQIADKIVEDGDIANLAGISTAQQARTGNSTVNRLRGHAWLYTCFERPTAKFPKGNVTVLVSNSMLLAEQRPQLDYVTPDGCPHSGVVYLHWDRRSDRFWSGSFITPLKDPQRIINRRETQNVEIIDRGMPKVFIQRGDLPESPTGAPMEIVELEKNANTPIINAGVGPGPWMASDLAHQVDNLNHTSTLSALRLGENPQGVETYSQLALLNDNEMSKRAPILHDHHRQIAKLVELSVYDMQKYWPPEKKILVAGQEDQIEQAIFDKTKIPTFYMASVATGAPAPKTQGAQLKMLDAIWAAAVQAWVAVQDGNTWVQWYSDSVKAGKPLDLPEAKGNTQKDLAYLENQQMIYGQVPQVMDYDQIAVHLPVHREAEDQARAAGDLATVERIVAHIQQHQAMAQQNAMNLAAQQMGAPPAGSSTQGAPGADGSGSFANYQPMPREPYPNRVGPEFSSLAAGQ